MSFSTTLLRTLYSCPAKTSPFSLLAPVEHTADEGQRQFGWVGDAAAESGRIGDGHEADVRRHRDDDARSRVNEQEGCPSHNVPGVPGDSAKGALADFEAEAVPCRLAAGRLL